MFFLHKNSLFLFECHHFVYWYVLLLIPAVLYHVLKSSFLIPFYGLQAMCVYWSTEFALLLCSMHNFACVPISLWMYMCMYLDIFMHTWGENDGCKPSVRRKDFENPGGHYVRRVETTLILNICLSLFFLLTTDCAGVTTLWYLACTLQSSGCSPG